MLKRVAHLILIVLVLALTLCGCNASEGLPTGATASPSVDDSPLSPNPGTDLTPAPAQDAQPAPTPTPAAIECNVYVMGHLLAHRAYLDFANAHAMMIPLESFVETAGLSMENEAAMVILRQDGGTTVVIDDIYSHQAICTVNGETTTLGDVFVSKGGVVYAPLELIANWFGYEWDQNPVGDVLITRVLPEPEATDDPDLPETEETA